MVFCYTVRRAATLAAVNVALFSCVVLISARSASAQARTAISTLFFTGITDAGASAAGNSVDAHYRLIGDPSSLTSVVSPGNLFVTVADGFPIGPWMDYSAANGASRWIEPGSGTTDTHLPGNYTIRTTFNLTGFVANSAQLNLQMASDNEVTAVRINGNTVSGVTANSFAAFSSATSITNANAIFVDGVNTIDFVLSNGTGAVTNPTGLRVEASGTAIVVSAAPEPGALPLMAMGLVSAGGGSLAVRKRRAKKA